MTGPQFFDDTKKLDLADAVRKATGLYSVRNGGRLAGICLVNETQYPAPPDYAAGIKVKAVRYVMPNHYWAGDK